MFDGIKIKCNDVADKLLKNDLLRFVSPLDETTGEIKPNKTAIYQNLRFGVGTLNNANRTPYANIKGSLHKYYNNGIHNANDFTFIDVANVIKELSEKFKIVPENTSITNIEIGVNINLSIPVSKFLKMLVSMPNDKFKDYKIGKIKVGKQFETTDKIIKIYDKGKLIGTNKIILPETNNLLRIEVKYKRIRPLQVKYGIKTLTDLTDFEKIKNLNNELLSIFENIIMYEKDIDTKKLTTKQLLRLKDYINPLYWEDLSDNETVHKKRHHKEQYRKFLDRYSIQKYKNEVLKLITEKWNLLINVQQINTPQFPKLNELNKADKYPSISNVNKSWKTGGKSSKDKNNKNNEIDNIKLPDFQTEKTQIEKRFCKNCGREISHQKKDSKFCSEKYFGKSAKKCRNKASNKNRQNKRIEKRQVEINNLKELNKILPETNYNLKIFRNTDKGIKTQRKKQKEVKLLKYKNLRKIIKVQVFINRKAMEFTTMRAKELIKTIISININI